MSPNRIFRRLLLPGLAAGWALLSLSCKKEDEPNPNFRPATAAPEESAEIKAAREHFMTRWRIAKQGQVASITHFTEMLARETARVEAQGNRVSDHRQKDMQRQLDEMHASLKKSDTMMEDKLREWEDKKWSGYQIPGKQPATAAAANAAPGGDILEEDDPFPNTAPATPKVTAARLDFLERSRARFEPFMAETKKKMEAANLRTKEIRDQLPPNVSKEEIRKRMDEVKTLLTAPGKELAEKRRALRTEERQQWIEWEAKNWEGYTLMTPEEKAAAEAVLRGGR